MPYIHTGWLCLIIIICIWAHIINSFVFFRRNLERLEKHLHGVSFISKNRDFYGESFFGKEMRQIFVILVIVMPGIFKKQEIINRATIDNVPTPLRNSVIAIFTSMNFIALGLGSLYYFRL